MRKLLIYFVLLAASLSMSVTSVFAQGKVGDQAPALKDIKVLNAKGVDLKSLKGKVVFLEFWATW